MPIFCKDSIEQAERKIAKKNNINKNRVLYERYKKQRCNKKNDLDYIFAFLLMRLQNVTKTCQVWVGDRV